MSLLREDDGSSANAAIVFAMGQLGKPYSWGAAGPDSYDCSGLVYSAYRSAGLDTIRRTTGEQVLQGDATNIASPGDLIFPHPGHVGLYVGNSQVIHAPTFGDKVKYGSTTQAYWGQPWAVRKIVSSGNGAATNAGGNGAPSGVDGSVLGSVLGGIVNPFRWLSSGHNWFRIVLGVMGSVALVVGISRIAGE